MFKKYRPSKYLCYLYFLLPLLSIIGSYSCKEKDIWFLLAYGRKVVSGGFPKYDFLSMHSNLSFVMQQWLSALSFYSVYKLLGGFGLFLLVVFVNILIMYFLYKLCNLLSDGKIFNSVITTCIIDVLLQIFFLTSRPYIYSLLLFIVLIYLLELFLKESSKKIYLLPVVSLLLINFHASMWLCFFVFSLPFLVEFSYLYYKKKDKRLFTLIIVLIISFLVGLINPYGIKNMFYSLTSYGVSIIDEEIVEMSRFTFKEPLFISNVSFLITFLITMFLMLKNKDKISISQFFLTFGISYMAFRNFRNVSIFYACVLPFWSKYLHFKEGKTYTFPLKLYVIVGVVALLYAGVEIANHDYTLINADQKYIDYLDKNATKDVKIYADYNNGSCLEYAGYHPYLDGRAEIFLKANNKKEDILVEAFNIGKKTTDYKKFLAKYDFDYILIEHKDYFYDYMKNNKNYKVVLKDKKKKLYKKIVEE